jgi:hypothetical protein
MLLSGWASPESKAGRLTDHGIFPWTLRALCQLRKVPLAVVVQNAGQVNVGTQQVNANSPGTR